jgi:twitching motility protein PilT
MVMEILIPTAAIRNLIREDKIHQIYSAMQTGTGAPGCRRSTRAWRTPISRS